jgi:DNA invertase Pin-like site-specific DNA recombinase
MINKRKRRKKQVTAVAYFRTSSAANVGEDKDSLKRQREAVESFAKRNSYQIVETFYDAAVSGADRIDQRDGFTDLLAYIRGNGAKTILVENATRFARDLTVQLTGHDLLKAEGYELIPVDAPTYFTEDNPTAELVRQVLGAISQFDKAQLVMKLKAARDRKSAKQGKRIEGRKPYQETRPELVKAAKSLAHGNRKEKLSLRAVSARLAKQGYTTGTGKLFSAEQVKRLLAAR